MNNDIKKSAVDILSRLNESDNFAIGIVEPAIKEEAVNWLERVDREIEKLNGEDLLFIAQIYDTVHRLAVGTPADKSKLNSISDRLLKVYKEGDLTVTAEDLRNLHAMSGTNGPVSVSQLFKQYFQ